MKLCPIVYLDADFITEAYETHTGKPVPVKITKSETISGGFSAAIFSAGASAHETKEFPISARAMYKTLRSHLDFFRTVDLATIRPKELPEYFWAAGVLAVASSQVTRNEEVLHRDSFFRLYPVDAKKEGVYLLTSDNYFSSGYDQVLRHLHGASRGFGIRVHALVKLLGLPKSGNCPLCTPLVMEKTGNA